MAIRPPTLVVQGTLELSSLCQYGGPHKGQCVLVPTWSSCQEGTLKKEYIAMFLIRIVFHLLRKWNISGEMTGRDQRQASRHIVGPWLSKAKVA